MTIWIDAQLSPMLAVGLPSLKSPASHCATWGLTNATDRQIFLAARRQSAIVMTKDADFVKLLEELGPPPQVIWITCGNNSNAHLRQLLETVWSRVLQLLAAGEPLIEVSDLRESESERK